MAFIYIPDVLRRRRVLSDGMYLLASTLILGNLLVRYRINYAGSMEAVVWHVCKHAFALAFAVMCILVLVKYVGYNYLNDRSRCRFYGKRYRCDKKDAASLLQDM